LRVLLVTEEFDPVKGGAERLLWETGRALTRLGLSVDVLANTSPLSYPWLHTLNGPSINRAAGLKRFAATVRSWSQEAGYDIVYSITPALGGDVYHPDAGCMPALFEAGVNQPRYGYQRSLKRLALKLNAKRQMLMALEREIAERGEALICPVSQKSADDFVRFYGLPEDRLEAVFNGINLEPLPAEERADWRARQRAAWNLGPDEKVMLFVGHDFERKGLETAIEALKLAVVQEKRPWRLMVVGRDNATPYFRQAVKLAVSRRVHWIGDVESVIAPMVGADLLALPSLFEPCGLVVLEAMTLGLPVAVSARCGAAEAIEPGVSGFVIDDPRDSLGLLKAMALIEEPLKAEAVAQAALEKKAFFHIDRMAGELARIFERILSQQS